MNKELLQLAMGMFDYPEKWNAFLELVSKKDTIRAQWYKEFKEVAKRKFLSVENVENWEYDTWGEECEMKWFQKKHGADSIQLQLIWGAEFRLHCNSRFNNLSRATELLKTPEYEKLIINPIKFTLFTQGESLASEVRNFSFGSPYDTKFDYDQLSWYAGNKTEEFLSQIVEKVNVFRKDETINLLLDKLNEQTKIS